MKNQYVFYCLFLISSCFFLTSCFTGKKYHYPRVKIEPSLPKTSFIHPVLLPVRPDSLELVKKQEEKEGEITDRKKTEVKIHKVSTWNKPIKPVIISGKMGQKKSILKKAEHPKRFRLGDAAEAIFALLFFLIIGLPSILLLIGGFLMGFFGIMVGFWICWIIGLLGIMFACIVYIAIWGSSGDTGIGGTFFYLFFFLLAIAFILIVLLI